MAQRKDNKNRNLLKGEYQRGDGRYSYRYVDSDGREQYVYSWTLTRSDKPPSDKPRGRCLRDLEVEINRMLGDGIVAHAGKTFTVNEVYESFIRSKRGIRNSTLSNYRCAYQAHIRDRIGTYKLDKVSYATIKSFYYSLLIEQGMKLGTLKALNSLLKQVFDFAVKMRYIVVNPCLGVITEIQRESDFETTKKKSLSPQECETFVNWIKQDRINLTYKLLVIFLLGTGCRIGEALALTWNDIDFASEKIHICKSFKVYTLDGTIRREISKPKTRSALRDIPMLPEVKQALSELKMAQRSRGVVSEEIDGYSGFVFIAKTGAVLLPVNISHSIVNAVNKYNRLEKEKAREERRSPNLLPVVTCHILRHTFCTMLCEYEPNIKVIQTIMGHASSVTTMDIYADAHQEQLTHSMRNIQEYYHIG